jgi:hypothetical protein
MKYRAESNKLKGIEAESQKLKAERDMSLGNEVKRSKC